jgi:hypothetical protein
MEKKPEIGNAERVGEKKPVERPVSEKLARHAGKTALKGKK